MSAIWIFMDFLKVILHEVYGASESYIARGVASPGIPKKYQEKRNPEFRCWEQPKVVLLMWCLSNQICLLAKLGIQVME